MADDKPKPYFDEEKQKAAQKWISDNFKKRECECCGENKWVLNSDITTTPILSEMIVLGGATYPYISLMCLGCGNTKLFNAVYAKVLKEKQEESKAEENKDGGQDGKPSN